MHDPTTAPSPIQSIQRLALRATATLTLFTLLWLAWYAYAAHTLASLQATYRARGEPVTARDLFRQPQPGDARQLAMDAASLLTQTDRDIVDPSSPVPIPWPPQHIEDFRLVLERHPKILGQFHSAVTAPTIAWPVDPDNPLNIGAQGLGQMREMVRLAAESARFYHQRNHDFDAMSTLQDALASGSICDQGPWLIHHLVAIACEALAANTVLDIAPDLQLQSPDFPGVASRTQLQELINRLLDEDATQENFRQSYRDERIFGPAVIKSLGWRASPLQPMFELDACRACRNYDVRVAALSPAIPTYPAVMACINRGSHPPTSNLQRAARCLSEDVATPDRAILLHYRSIVHRNLAALRLAIRLYELDHHNSLPDRLDRLVPQYIAKIPSDLFRADNGPPTYDPLRRVLYSVGEDGLDNGGTDTPTPGQITWRGRDYVIPFDRPTSTSAPATAE